MDPLAHGLLIYDSAPVRAGWLLATQPAAVLGLQLGALDDLTTGVGTTAAMLDAHPWGVAGAATVAGATSVCHTCRMYHRAVCAGDSVVAAVRPTAAASDTLPLAIRNTSVVRLAVGCGSSNVMRGHAVCDAGGGCVAAARASCAALTTTSPGSVSGARVRPTAGDIATCDRAPLAGETGLSSAIRVHGHAVMDA